MTTIVMASYDLFKWQRHITLAALNCVRRFTDPPYELILIDQADDGHGGPYNRWEIIRPDKHLKPGDIGYSASMNLGAKEADPKSKYLVFMHNDIFVQDGWLPILIECEKAGLGSVIYPDQIARTRENILQSRQEEWPSGYDEAGLFLMSRKTYEESGGWDERFKAVYQDIAFHRKLYAVGKTLYCTMKTFTTHIGSVGYAYSTEAEQENLSKEGAILNGEG